MRPAELVRALREIAADSYTSESTRLVLESAARYIEETIGGNGGRGSDSDSDHGDDRSLDRPNGNGKGEA